MSKRDDGFLRYKVWLERPDGSTKVLEHEATAHRCTIIENRFNRAARLSGNNGAKLRCSISKVL